jgi:hypothetical protein
MLSHTGIGTYVFCMTMVTCKFCGSTPFTSPKPCDILPQRCLIPSYSPWFVLSTSISSSLSWLFRREVPTTTIKIKNGTKMTYHVDIVDIMVAAGGIYLHVYVNVYAIIIVLCISIDKSNIRTRSLRNIHSQET